MSEEKPLSLITPKVAILFLLLSTQLTSLSDGNSHLTEKLVSDKLPIIEPANSTVVMATSRTMTDFNVSHFGLLSGCVPRLSLENRHSINEVSLPMKIEFRQSGGYGGLITGTEINTDSLTAKEAAELQSLVEQSDILQAQNKQTPNSADLLQYQIIIKTEKGVRQVSYDDLSLPESAVPLLEYLQDRAKPIRR